MKKMVVLAVVVAFALSAMPLFAAEGGCAKCDKAITCPKCSTSSFQVVADTINCMKPPPRGCGNVPKLIPIPPQDVTIFSSAAKNIQHIDKCNCAACKAVSK